MQPRATMRQSGEMALRMRRPPQEYVTLLSQSEQEFRTFVDSFESDPAFRKLVNDGAILRVRLRGKIPRERYEEFMDRQLLEFLRQYGITEKDGWERDLLSTGAVSRVAELATKYQAPVGEMLRHLRYIRSAGQDALTNTALALHGKSAAPDATSFDDTTAGQEMVDLADVIETTREFVQRYKVSEQDFLDLVLGGDSTPEELAQRLGCSLREGEEVLEAADRVYLAQSYEAAGQLTPVRERAGQSTPTRSDDDLVAFVQVVDEKLAIQFHYDSVYTHRYHIKKDLLQEGAKQPNNSEAVQEARDLLLRARFINQRLSVLSRLITTLCNQQTEYLVTGDLRQLKPLAQAELARQLGEHPSTVSRLIRSKVIDTPWGRTPLLFLCQSKTDVVARLVAQYPGLTDQEVVSRLREEYDCYIARRTVAYHRGKRLRRNKQHKRTQTTGTESSTDQAATK